MKVKITEIPTQTTTKPKVIGGEFHIERISDAESKIIDFMRKHKFERVSFQITGSAKKIIEFEEEKEA